MEHFKDAILEELSRSANVAQFVSFGPGPSPQKRFARIRGMTSLGLESVEGWVSALLARSGEGSVNIRSFDPAQPKSNEFLYGLVDLDTAAAEVRRLARGGFHTIVNETIDIRDGGVSGVSYAGVLEFAPDDTPRSVEKPGTASFPGDLGTTILSTIYGFEPALDFPHDARVEFSLHPLRRGFRRDHTIVWELEKAEPIQLEAPVRWPNRFSNFLGDKTFGLIVADAIGLPVPYSTVISRRVAPFAFGTHTGTGEYWTRTAPATQDPGRFTTIRGWTDPFAVLENEDPMGQRISSVLAQEGVEAVHSGALVAGQADLIIEGVEGFGDLFMEGSRPPEPLPPQVVEDVRNVYWRANRDLGPVRFEWVHDGTTAWVIQLHTGPTAASGSILYPGETTVEHRFPIERGLEALRAFAHDLSGTGEGIVLVGSVGVTSHFGDVLRRARIPSRVESRA